MAIQCKIRDCTLDTFLPHAECVLHCKKGDYSEDYINNQILPKFYNELINYISDYFQVTLATNPPNNGSWTSFKEFLDDNNETITYKSLLNTVIVFDGIFFPCRDGRDRFDYLKLLKKLELVHFIRCKFTAHSLEINQNSVFYDECEFHQWWSLTKTKLLSNVNNVLYQNCLFHHDVNSYTYDNGTGIFSEPLFNDCKFEKKLELTNTIFEAPIFNNTNDTNLYCSYIQIHDCTIKEKFSLNSTTLEELDIKNSEFIDKFEFKENKVIKFNLDNVNFKKIFDAYNTKFNEFSAYKSIFEGFVGFEMCKFGKEDNLEKKHLSKFTYVTFLSFTNFRNTVFHSGLDLQNTNLKEPPNFLNISTHLKSTNRETYRIIKNSFDGIGNHIEANKFFVFEMKKYKEELKDKPCSQEKVIFYINSIISNFGESFFRPICWLIFTSIIYYFLEQGYQNKILYQFNPILSGNISVAVEQLNVMASNIQPFKTFLTKGKEFVDLIFYIISASLIWQIIVAVKRYTKR